MRTTKENMKAKWTILALTIWLNGWLSAMYIGSGFTAAIGFMVILGITGMLAYQVGRGDSAWK